MTIKELCECCLSISDTTIICIMDENSKVLNYKELGATSSVMLLSKVVNFTIDMDNTVIVNIEAVAKTAKSVKYPCRNCIYYDTCGESGRTHPCDDRKTKSEAKKEAETGGK